MTFDLAKQLIETTKSLQDEGALVYDRRLVSQQWYLESPSMPEYEYVWTSITGRINKQKLSLMVREKGSNEGLIRVEYNAINTHLNPLHITDDVPEFLHEYVNFKIEQNVPHIHFAVKGYKSLVWAVPISDFTGEFFVMPKENDEQTVENTVNAFAKNIHLENEITFLP